MQAGDLSFSLDTSSSVNKVNSIVIRSGATATRYNSVAIVVLLQTLLMDHSCMV